MKAIRLIPIGVGYALLCGVSSLHAQSVAYVSSEAIFQRLPQAVEARLKLGEMQSKWTAEIRRFESSANGLRDEIEKNRLLWSPQERVKKEGELRDVESQLVTYRTGKFGPNGEFEKMYRDLMSPVVNLVVVAVNAEAESKGYDFVFDKSSRGLPLLFANAKHDLTYDVLKRMGVSVDPAELKEKEEKPLIVLPESLPIQIGRDDGGPMTIDPRTTIPRLPESIDPVVNDPNAILKENEEEEED